MNTENFHSAYAIENAGSRTFRLPETSAMAGRKYAPAKAVIYTACINKNDPPIYLANTRAHCEFQATFMASYLEITLRNHRMSF